MWSPIGSPLSLHYNLKLPIFLLVNNLYHNYFVWYNFTTLELTEAHSNWLYSILWHCSFHNFVSKLTLWFRNYGSRFDDNCQYFTKCWYCQHFVRRATVTEKHYLIQRRMKRVYKKLCLYILLAFLMLCLFNVLSPKSGPDDLKYYDGKFYYIFWFSSHILFSSYLFQICWKRITIIVKVSNIWQY